jgi:hypothetical protein
MHNLFLRTFSVSKQQKNAHTLGKPSVQNMWQEVTNYLNFCQKRSVKLTAIVKIKVQNKNSCNEQGSELVGNELMTGIFG